jgi:ribosome biogenesis ATPase
MYCYSLQIKNGIKKKKNCKLQETHCILQELDVPLMNVAGPELIAGVSGESEERIRDLFDQAAENAPCILFLDEVDALAPNRHTAQREMERRVVAQLLSCLDGGYDVPCKCCARRSILVEALCCKPEVAGSRPDEVNCFNLPNPSGRARPRGYSVSNRNEYQKQKNNVSGE